MKKVSIHIFNYNQAKFLRACIESVEASTITDIEIIISDNGSTDNSRDVIENYNFKYPCQKLYYKKNGPLGHRLLRSLSKGSSEYFCILNADDYFMPSKLERQLTYLEEFPKCLFAISEGYRYFINTSIITYDKSFRINHSRPLHFVEALPQRAHINPVSFLCRRSVLDSFHLPYFDVYAEGEDYFLRVLSYSPGFLCKEPLVVMTDHESNMGKDILTNSQYYQSDAVRLSWNAYKLGLDSYFLALRRYRRQMLDYAWQTYRLGKQVFLIQDFLRQSGGLYLFRSPKNIIKFIFLKFYAIARH